MENNETMKDLSERWSGKLSSHATFPAGENMKNVARIFTSGVTKIHEASAFM